MTSTSLVNDQLSTNRRSSWTVSQERSERPLICQSGHPGSHREPSCFDLVVESDFLG